MNFLDEIYNLTRTAPKDIIVCLFDILRVVISIVFHTIFVIQNVGILFFRTYHILLCLIYIIIDKINYIIQKAWCFIYDFLEKEQNRCENLSNWVQQKQSMYIESSTIATIIPAQSNANELQA